MKTTSTLTATSISIKTRRSGGFPVINIISVVAALVAVFFAVLAASLLTAFAADGQAKADFKVQAMVNAARDESVDYTNVQKEEMLLPESVDAARSLPLMISLDSPESVAKLEDAGVKVITSVEGYVACMVPLALYEEVLEMPEVQTVSPINRYRVYNDRVRAATGIDRLHNGEEMPSEIRGKGVIVSIFDTGVDPNHINFKDAQGSESRVKRVWSYGYGSSSGVPNEEVYDTPELIASFTTDNASGSHGTHVLGIAAGAFTGEGHSDAVGDYSGMAPDADLAIACGTLTDAAILQGLQNIIAYAKEEGKPVIINMSFGANLGHHDGSSSFCEAINKLAATTPMCISAGNEGDGNFVAKKTATEGDTRLITFFQPTASQAAYDARYQAIGSFEVIADDATPFTLSVGLYDMNEGKVVTKVDAGEVGYQYMGGSRCPFKNTSYCTVDSIFEDTFTSDSYFGCAAAVCPDNGRYYGMITADLYNLSTSPTVFPVLIVDGVEGHRYEVYGDARYTEFSDKGVAGFTPATHDGTINDLACGPNTICVGSYVTSNPTKARNITIGDIAFYSSYGTLTDGRTLPHFCAPGSSPISSYSRYFVDGSFYDDNNYPVMQTVVADSTKYYWGPMQGTSMASPAAAGSIALWLEINPDLSPSEIIEIAQATATEPETSEVTLSSTSTDEAKVQWGAGKLNAFEGAKRVYATTSALTVIDRGVSTIMIRPCGGNLFEVYADDEQNFTADVYDLSGKRVASTTSSGETVRVDLASVSPGVYLMKVAGTHSSTAEKVMVR